LFVLLLILASAAAAHRLAQRKLLRLLALTHGGHRGHVVAARVVIHDTFALLLLLAVSRTSSFPFVFTGLSQFLLVARHEPCCLRSHPGPLATIVRALASSLHIHSALCVGGGRLADLVPPLLDYRCKLFLNL